MSGWQTAASSSRRISLLESDPELGGLLEPAARDRAEHELIVRVAQLDRGGWDIGRLVDASCLNVGLLLLDCVVAREVVLNGDVSTELLGPGDLVRPWRAEADAGLVAAESRWNVLQRGRVAVLDQAFAARAAAFPAVMAMLLERVEARARRLAVAKGIAHITRVDERLLAMLWHLAERWGRVLPDGTALPLCLSHRILGELIGARRPSVSTAAGMLERDGRLVRRADGSWLLRGTPVTGSAGAPESVPQRRLVPVPDEDAGSIDGAPDRLRDDLTRRVEALRETVSVTAELCRESRALRDRRPTRASLR